MNTFVVVDVDVVQKEMFLFSNPVHRERSLPTFSLFHPTLQVPWTQPMQTGLAPKAEAAAPGAVLKRGVGGGGAIIIDPG